ncbi:HDOD domain-containing protein [Herbaspirillum sp. RV1423]|uniref:HDOD domain-containing protein n=1 Tax=Herbaspirillum sp. RV1423 TaxID=1443993 RepID=UPI0004B24449|nr:HDOD domain-containing protein [Herbaspirillum sp. RV1423]
MSPLTSEEITDAVLQLPSLPNIVIELINALDNSDVDTNTLAQKISHDQALTAKVLGLANSSFYGMQSKVGSIPHAVAVLGFNSVRSLVTAAAVVETFSAGKSQGLDYAEFWKHSIATALAAKAIAKCLGLNQDSAFIAGLLHNIGRLVLATYSPMRYQEVLSWRSVHDGDLIAAEVHILGIDHKTAGRAVLQHWKFPSSIVDTLNAASETNPHEHHRAASLVAVADAIAYGLDLSGGEHDRVPGISQMEWDLLGLQETALMEIFEATEMQFEEACMILVATAKV